MEYATALHLRRVRSDAIIIVPVDFGIYVVAVELLSFFALDEEQIEKIHEAFLEFLQKLSPSSLLFARQLVEGLEEIAFAGSGHHLSLQDFFVEVKVHLFS